MAYFLVKLFNFWFSTLLNKINFNLHLNFVNWGKFNNLS